MGYFLGIDGGGSKTAALVGDDERELGRAEGPSCKIQAVGEAVARAALHDVMKQACANAQVSLGDVSRVCLGISGASNREVAARVQQFVEDLTPAIVEVVGDNVIALEATVGSGPGVVVIAGTGSIAYGRNERGQEARAGGFGPIISDEGSGTWIGKNAVRAALDFGNDSLLRRKLLQAWECETDAQLVTLINRTAVAEFAGLFPVVLAAEAEEPEGPARVVLQDAGVELAGLAGAVIKRLSFGDFAVVQVGLIGGVFRHSATVRESFTAELRKRCGSASVSQTVSEAAAGALQLARKASTASSRTSRSSL